MLEMHHIIKTVHDTCFIMITSVLIGLHNFPRVTAPLHYELIVPQSVQERASNFGSDSIEICHIFQRQSITFIQRRDSAVGITTGYWLGDQRVGVRVPVWVRTFISPCRPDRL
jgi:hypothetical protein